MSDDREKLKALLLSEEMAQIEALRKLWSDNQLLSAKISEVLGQAADLTIAKDPSFQKKFSKIDSKSYVKAIKANKEMFIDTLTPIMGPMIRRSVTSAIRRLSSDINRAIELGFSAKALKWRWLAFRTGVPFTEIVFNNTIEYQVQQIFLIDNNTGLLIQHAGHEESLLQDKDAFSAMLTAIQDFVKESVTNEGQSLTAAELGDSLVWLVPGNRANIAVVIKGAPTQRLHNTFIQATENIHIEFHHEIADEKLWNNNPELKVELEKLLLTKTQSDPENEKKKSNFGLWLFLFLLLSLLSWAVWSTYKEHQLHKRITTQLNQTPGFILSDLEHKEDEFIASGLQDPLTDFSHLDEKVTIKGTPFISLDDDIIKLRIEKILDEPNIIVQVKDQMVTLQGAVNKTQAVNQRITFASMLPGISRLTDLSTQYPVLETWESYIQSNPIPNGIEAKKVNDTIHLSGASTQQNFDELINKVKKFGKIDSTAVEVFSINELEQLITKIPMNIINTTALNLQQTGRLDEIALTFKKMLIIRRDAKIQLTAQSDCQGPALISNTNSQSRLSLVQSYLTAKGINNKNITTNIMKCTTDTGQKDHSKIVVKFEVIQ